MTREEFYNELQMNLVERFMALSEEDKIIMRKGHDSELASVYRKILGNEILSGLPKLRKAE